MTVDLNERARTFTGECGDHTILVKWDHEFAHELRVWFVPNGSSIDTVAPIFEGQTGPLDHVGVDEKPILLAVSEAMSHIAHSMDF